MVQRFGFIPALAALALSACASAPREVRERREITAKMNDHRKGFFSCFKSEQERTKVVPQGTVLLSFNIQPEGFVTNTNIESSTLNSTSMEICILAELKRIRFNAIPSNDIHSAVYPITFDR